MAALAAVGLIADAASEADRSGSNETLLTAAIVAATAAGLVALRVMWSNLRSAVVLKPTLEISDDAMIVRHEGIFKEPVRIDRPDIRMISIDDRPARRRGRSHPRFELPSEEPGSPRWLYSRVGGSPFPLLSQVPDVPNLVIVFERPIVLHPPRRFVKAFPSKQMFFPPLKGRASRGLLMRLKDPDGVRQVLADLYPLRPPTHEDLPEPDTATVGRARRLSLRDNAVLGALIVAQFALPLFFSDESTEPPGSETFTALGRICGTTDVRIAPYEPSTESLGELLLDDPSGMSLMFDSPIDLGDAALSSRGDVPRWTRELLEEGFERGYARRWSAPGRVVLTTVWEFRTDDGAEDFEIFARNDICPFLQDAFLVPELDEAVGMTTQTDNETLDQIVFLRGRYRFLVRVETRIAPDDHSAVIDLARRLAAGLEADR